MSYLEKVGKVSGAPVLDKWKKRFGVEVGVEGKNVRVNLSPYPPDTVETVHEFMIEKGGMEKLQEEADVTLEYDKGSDPPGLIVS